MVEVRHTGSTTIDVEGAERGYNHYPEMKKIFLSAFIVILLGILVWGFVTPSGIRGAWANNVWSTKFVKAYFADAPVNLPLPSPPDTHAHSSIFLVKQALKQEDYDKALEYITPLVASRNPVVLEIYAQVLYQQGKYLDAFEVWESNGNTGALWRAAWEMSDAKRQDLATSAARSLYNLDPESYSGFYADSLRYLPDFVSAVKVLNSSLQYFPNSENTGQWRKLLSDIYNRMGDEFVKNQQLSQAEDYYNQAIGTYDKNWAPWKNLGWLYYTRDNDPEKAIWYFKKVIELYPESGEGYRDIGDIYLKEKQYNLALDWFRKTTDIFPDKPDFLLKYAGLLRETGQIEEAIEAYNTVVDRFPNEAWAYYEMAIAYSRHNQPDEAITAIENAIALNKGIPAFHTLAGQAYEQGGYPDKALEAYKNALAIDPGNGWAKDAVERLSGSK